MAVRPATEIVATVLLGIVAGFQVLMLVLVASSFLGDDANDPHGYSRIFGIFVIVVTLPITLLLLMVRTWARARR